MLMQCFRFYMAAEHHVGAAVTEMSVDSSVQYVFFIYYILATSLVLSD